MLTVALFKPISIGTLLNCTEKLALKVSVPSMILSHITGMLNDLLFSPGPNVMLIGSETKSTPDPTKNLLLKIKLVS